MFFETGSEFLGNEPLTIYNLGLSKLMLGKFELARKLFDKAMVFEEELKEKDRSTKASCLFIPHYSDGQVSLEELKIETEKIDLIECLKSSVECLGKMIEK